MMSFMILELYAEKTISPETKAHTWIASANITEEYILCAFNTLAVLRHNECVSLCFRTPYNSNTLKLYQDNVCFIDK